MLCAAAVLPASAQHRLLQQQHLLRLHNVAAAAEKRPAGLAAWLLLLRCQPG
jgi:hypothetical protein